MKKTYSNSNNIILRVLFALSVSDGENIMSKDIIDKVVEVIKFLLEENEEALSTIDMPDTTVNELFRNTYVDRCDLNGNLHLNMSKNEADEIIEENEGLANIIYSSLLLLSYSSEIRERVNTPTEFYLDSPDRDYYLTSQDYTNYEEKLYTDGDIIELEDVNGENYNQKHVKVSNSTFSIIAVLKNNELLACVVRNNVLDSEYIAEKITDIENKTIDNYSKMVNNKIYKLMLN